MVVICAEVTSSALQNWTAFSIILSGIAATSGIFLSYKVYLGQKLLSQRQLIVPLWQYISSLNEIDPAKPITPDIIKAANTMELIAITCEGGMIDKSVIKRTFADQFIKHCDNIKACASIPGFTNKTGTDILREAPATLSFYDELMTDLKNKNKIK